MRAEELNRFFKWVVISVLVFHPMVPTASHRFFSRNHRAVSPRASPSAAFMRELYAPGSLFTSRQRSNSSPIDLSTAKSKSMSLKLALMNPPPLLLCIFLKDKIYWLFSFLFFFSRELQLLKLRRLDCKVEIQGLTKIHPQFLSRTYLPAKIQSMAWM